MLKLIHFISLDSAYFEQAALDLTKVVNQMKALWRNRLSLT